MILDAGVLIAIDRGEESARQFLTAAERSGQRLHTTAVVAAQVWRDGSTQARLARALQAMTVHSFSGADVPAVGELLRRSGTKDVVDAHLFVVAERTSHDIVTADVADYMSLREAARSPKPNIHRW